MRMDVADDAILGEGARTAAGCLRKHGSFAFNIAPSNHRPLP